MALFGKRLAASSVGNELFFQRRPIDASTGLYDFRYRWYSPDLMRFVSRDPMGYAAGDVNLYRFAGNDPVNKRDPLGLTTSMPFGQDNWSPSYLAPFIKIKDAMQTIDNFFMCAENIRQSYTNSLESDTSKHCIASCRISKECYGKEGALAIGVLKEGIDLISPLLVMFNIKDKPDNPEWRDIQNDYEGFKCSNSAKSCEECCIGQTCKKH